MSRSSLFDLVRRAYRISRLSIATNTPPTEVSGLLNERLSRRQMLGGLVVMGHLGISTQWGDRLTSSLTSSALPHASDAAILVVGAGVAGLTAAYRLRQAGVEVDVIEASPRVGGRLVSLNVPNIASPVELGGEFIDSRHIHVRSLATELGLETADLKVADQGLVPEILYFQGKTITHDQVIEAFVPLAERIAADLQHLNRSDLTYRNPSPAAVQLDRLSLAEYLASASVDPIIEQLVKVAYVTEFGRNADDQSCLNMLFLIGAEVGKWSTYGISDERYHIVGGNEQLPRKLAERLENRIETGMALESIRQSADGTYRVSLRSGATSMERRYDHVLLTVPFSILRQIDLAVDLPPVKRNVIAELGYGSSTKLVTPYRERIWRSRYASTISIYSDQEFQNTWESARYTLGTSGWLTNLRGGTAGIQLGTGDPEHHAQTLATNLEPLLPGISQVQRGRSICAVWTANPYAQGSYSCYCPGQWTQFAGAEAERVGNLWFAGEHCSIASQGYINGACETAEVAALGILKALGLQERVEGRSTTSTIRNKLVT